MNKITVFLNKIYALFKQSLKECPSNILYKIVEIKQNESNKYIVTIQVKGKNIPFQITPEKILAYDKITEKFSQKDVRTLTYLGYSNQNIPKYQVVAKRYLKKLDKIAFAVYEKESDKLTTKTADQISNNLEILNNLQQQDAHMIGYTAALEHTHAEIEQKRKAIVNSKKELLPAENEA